ncbi:hypothetical protein ACWIGE_14780 [Streptomyces diastaticus]
MAVIALVGTPGAPGATTTALALLRSWPLPDGQRIVLAECDPDGSAVLPGLLRGEVPADHGLSKLTASATGQALADAFWRQLLYLENDEARPEQNRMLLAGITDHADTVRLQPVWGQLSDLFQAIDPNRTTVLVDLGRAGPFGASGVLAMRADAVLLVVRGTMRGLQAAKSRVGRLRQLLDAEGRGVDALGLVLVEEGPYTRREVQSALEVPVVMALPYVPQEAAVLSDGAPEGRKFLSGKLMRSAADGVTALRQMTAWRTARVESGVQRLLRGGVGGAR